MNLFLFLSLIHIASIWAVIQSRLMVKWSDFMMEIDPRTMIFDWLYYWGSGVSLRGWLSWAISI
jgi:hypothetical protein